MITDFVLKKNKKDCWVNTARPPERVLKGIWKQKEAQWSQDISHDR